MTRVAAFDCGTNSLRLLVADLDPATGTEEEIVREMRIVRLGQGVDRTGRIADASLQRVFAAIEEFMELVREHDARQIRFCATSAARDAENADEFLSGARERVGHKRAVVQPDHPAGPTLDSVWPFISLRAARPSPPYHATTCRATARSRLTHFWPTRSGWGFRRMAFKSRSVSTLRRERLG